MTESATVPNETAGLHEAARSMTAVLEELIRIGGAPLRTTWPGVLRLCRNCATAVEHPELIDDDGGAEFVGLVRSAARGMFGGYGSFTDFGVDGPEAGRFERLKDELSALIGRL